MKGHPMTDPHPLMAAETAGPDLICRMCGLPASEHDATDDDAHGPWDAPAPHYDSHGRLKHHCTMNHCPDLNENAMRAIPPQNACLCSVAIPGATRESMEAPGPQHDQRCEKYHAAVPPREAMNVRYDSGCPCGLQHSGPWCYGGYQTEVSALRAALQSERACRLANEQEMRRADTEIGQLRAALVAEREARELAEAEARDGNEQTRLMSVQALRERDRAIASATAAERSLEVARAEIGRLTGAVDRRVMELKAALLEVAGSRDIAEAHVLVGIKANGEHEIGPWTHAYDAISEVLRKARALSQTGEGGT